jgi:parvulin-like peptidyl-prolyl isomerase
LQPGQISGVVPSDLGGFHIVQVLERDSSRPLSDDALREAQQMAVQDWLDTLKASATIERLIK